MYTVNNKDTTLDLLYIINDHINNYSYIYIHIVLQINIFTYVYIYIYLYVYIHYTLLAAYCIQ